MTPAAFRLWLHAQARSYRVRGPSAREWVGIMARLATVRRDEDPTEPVWVAIDVTSGGLPHFDEYRRPRPDTHDNLRKPA